MKFTVTGLFHQHLYFPDQQQSCACYYLDNDSTMPGNASSVRYIHQLTSGVRTKRS